MRGFYGVRPGISARLGKNKEFSWLRQRGASGVVKQAIEAVVAYRGQRGSRG